MDEDLACNIAKCRKLVSDSAWVTSCSHIFCDADGTREFQEKQCPSCPVCGSILSEALSVIKVNLRPAEAYKSMVLAGQKPEVVFEICHRALSFWLYQVQQERKHQEHISNKSRERLEQIKQHYLQLITAMQADANRVKSQMENKEKELHETKKKLADANDKIAERARQLQRLQSMYDQLRRKLIDVGTPTRPPTAAPFPTSAVRESASARAAGRFMSTADLIGFAAIDTVDSEPTKLVPPPHLAAPRISHPQDAANEFVFRPIGISSPPPFDSSRFAVLEPGAPINVLPQPPHRRR